MPCDSVQEMVCNLIRHEAFSLELNPASCVLGRGEQAAVAVPGEGGFITVHSATQSLDTVQRCVAATLGIPHHQVLQSGHPCQPAVVVMAFPPSFGGTVESR